MPKREVYITPQENNLIGPWTININGQQVEFNALNFNDTASNPVKLGYVLYGTLSYLAPLLVPHVFLFILESCQCSGRN